MVAQNFVGRQRQLDKLGEHLAWVAKGGADQRGRCVIIRGRRRVGKSRLIEVFSQKAHASGTPTFWFTCTEGESPAAEREQFVNELAESGLAHCDEVGGDAPGTWHIAFRRLADALADDRPSIVVIDELPWLTGQDRAAEGSLQTTWDRYLSKKPVLLILIGSDLSVMEHLTTYGRPFHQRGVEMVLDPLNPADVAAITGLDAAQAFDAFLITGGLPLICQSWPKGATRDEFLALSFRDPGSPLIVSGERIVRAEFPSSTRALDVLGAIGSGERTFSNIASKVGGDSPLPSGTLNPALRTLLEKRVIAVDEPLSLRPAPKERRYRIADPFLRFWLRFIHPSLPEVERGRADLAMRMVDKGWDSWRGKAIEPVVREALHTLLPDATFREALAVGGWWNRINNPEVDLVALDTATDKGHLAFVGSIKWRERAPFDRADFAALARDAAQVPGFDRSTPLVAVSRAGSTATDLAAAWSPEDLLAAWPNPSNR
jgi:uncharacterized protein